jgi:hypothetical protein
MKTSIVGVCVITLLAASGCGDTATVIGEEGSAQPLLPGETYTSPLYVIQSLIFGDEGQSSYVLLRDELVAEPTITLDGQGREFPGYSPADPVNGKLAVGSGDSPTLQFFSISDAKNWADEATISFSGFTTEALAGNVAVSPSKAYVPFQRTNHSKYDPETFEISGEVGAPPDIPLSREGALIANRGFGQQLRDGLLFQPYYFADEGFQSYSPDSMIAVIDTTTDTIAPSTSAPCPHLHITTADEDGNLYFSNGQGSIAAALLTPGNAPNCFARINAGETTVDPSSITWFRDLAEGREGSNLFYIGGGKALFNVYHAERDDIGPDSEFATVDMSSSYHLWTLDLATGAAAMLDGIDFAGGQFTALRVDDRTIITIPAADYSSTTFYELTADLTLTKLFDVQGWAFKTFRLR